MGLEPTTLYTLDRPLYQLSYRGSSAGWAQISHLIVHLMNRLYMYMLMRDEEGRKKEASKVKQTTRQNNTAHPRKSLFQRKNKLSRVGFEPMYIFPLLHIVYNYMYIYVLETLSKGGFAYCTVLSNPDYCTYT